MKANLSLTHWVHIALALILLAKVSPAILDYLDIFILALEEQNIPKVNIVLMYVHQHSISYICM